MTGHTEALSELIDVVARLRGPGGCPWDRAQDHHSLIPYLLEEAYELAAALEGTDPEQIKEELGDLLLQILLHAQLESEAGRFGIGEVAKALRDKLVRRHPHVFGNAAAGTPAQVRRRWEEIKRRGEGRGMDLARPALVAARKYLAVRDNDHRPEFVTPPAHTDQPELVVGKMLLEVAAVAHRWGVEPELALRKHLANLERTPPDPAG
ncbi:MAG: MazG nucleotide pyrophosphohydrolase domain-containing protein [Candidatus Bipolaricaulaceae bacterium]